MYIRDLIQIGRVQRDKSGL